MAFNMSNVKNPMPVQDPKVRGKNFEEVALGYTEETAIDEAKRCLNCRNPVGVANMRRIIERNGWEEVK